MLAVLSHADTDLLSVTRAAARLPDDFPAVRCANPATLDDPDGLLAEARVVVVRLLGGRQAWPEGVDRLLAQPGLTVVLLGGEPAPDAELADLSRAPAGAVAEVFEYLRHGGVDNAESLLRFLSDTFLLTGWGFDDPQPLDEDGGYEPGRGPVALAGLLSTYAPGPRVGIVFYRSHLVSGNTAFVDAIAQAVDRAGGSALCCWAQTLRPGADGRVPVLEAIADHVDALIVSVLASGGATAADADDDAWGAWHAEALTALGVPVFQALCVTRSRRAWEDSDSGLSPMDVAMQVAIPEFDGRVLGGVACFKESTDDGAAVYVPDVERCERLARRVVRHVRLRHTPPESKRVALMLSTFPTKHARIGNAVGLDTPASAIALLHALRDRGYEVSDVADDGDALIHRLIDAGGYDPDAVTDAQLAAATARLPVRDYVAWFAALPGALREKVQQTWGPPPGDQWRDGDDLVFAGLDLGGVFVALQPPRGYGENPTAIYHDPELAPSHHYLACYWWLDRVWGADALVHLGKHGTLEWLPGKAVGLSDACAPDAVLGSLPAVYPFVVNDPGEGVQAKRRMHAVIVDHLIPPMARAGMHDELAELEDLLDEYARMEALDPTKLPALASRIWQALHEANLDDDLGLEAKRRPDTDFGAVIEHVDGYLCELKDLQVRDGLHVLGAAPEGEPLRNLVAACLRLPFAGAPALRPAIARAFGLDEGALVADPGALVVDAPADLLVRFPGPDRSGADLIDRLDAAQHALLDALAAGDWDRGLVAGACSAVLGLRDDDVQRALRLACDEVVPRLRETDGEIEAVLRVLDGRHLAAGPSGSPTRGRLDVLPTGRNFYGVDPKALPSELSFDVGRRLGDALLRRHLEEDGRHPESVGLVAWGTAAMRTHGDDIAEALWLLGVRPVWDASTRRVTGLEVVDLDELGRPRIDVVLRISGFFRDALPHLIALVDEAVCTVAALDEPDKLNFVRKHVRADADRLAAELGEGAWRRATARVFGSKPGSYGAGLLELVEARSWRDEADLAAVYETWGGYAYGQGLDGAEARGALRDCLARVEIAVKNVDTREHDLFDSDAYFQYHGGMVAAVKAITGRAPRSFMGDSADPATVHARTLAEEARRVFRARVTNPRWIAAMVRHGYKGAFELAATVDFLFGYDATTGVVADWMYESVAEKYVADPDVNAFLRRSNPWALHAMTERLLEAAERGMWEQPEAATLDALRGELVDVEGHLEDRGAPA